MATLEFNKKKKADAEERKALLARKREEKRAEKLNKPVKKAKPCPKGPSKPLEADDVENFCGRVLADLIPPPKRKQLISESESEASSVSVTGIETDMAQIRATIDDSNIGQFVAVYFDEDYYWGKIRKIWADDPDEDATGLELKYLHREAVASAVPVWKWPEKEDVDPNVNMNVVFFGPVHSIVANETLTRTKYRFDDEEQVSARYKALREVGGPQ